MINGLKKPSNESSSFTADSSFVPTIAYIGVGSNLGDRKQTIECAKTLLSETRGVRFLRSAPLYETKPVGGPQGQGMYVNTVWEIETTLTGPKLMESLLAIETHLGRERSSENSPRTIDLDLLFWGDEILNQSGLSVPHPRLHERWFVLKPLWDLRADFVHPVLKKSICELLDRVHENH
ncbi:MAG: 2-amino-4-hydroxy-6-hydroxymethyldihydropteridine diphosphokinase [Candidatus Omnitrophica bacterium]|nr:2-amino-4-hydroxy-6-hydroxymethyldihydropteridine diphosphokinase [Candidatus Omnitrophota bacterium]